MKTATLLILMSTNTFAQTSDLKLDDINLEGNIHQKSFEEKLSDRRHRLEEQTLKRLVKQMEIQRIKNEILMSIQVEKALTDNLKKVNIE